MRAVTICLIGNLLSQLLLAQQPTSSASAQQAPAQKSISSQLGLHAFPAKNQTAEQQQTDEISCYRWAKQDTGFDPVAALTAAQSAKGSTPAPASSPSGPSPAAGAQGAARGAATGAAIGAIAGDAGKGAAIGAAGGGIRGKMAQRRAQAEAQQKAQQQSQQQAQQQAQAKAQTQSSMDDFRKAYSACMDAKGYSVK